MRLDSGVCFPEPIPSLLISHRPLEVAGANPPSSGVPIALAPCGDSAVALVSWASRLVTIAANSIEAGINFKYRCVSTIDECPAYSLIPFRGTPAKARFVKHVCRRS